MSIIRWVGNGNIFSQVNRMQREMDQLLSTFGPTFGTPTRPVSRPSIYPAVNVFDDGDNYIVRAEVPGVELKDLDITVTGDTLTIKGERELTEIPEDASFHRRERDSGRFRRSLSLFENIDSSKVKASCKNGILEVILPRSEQAKERKVEVKAG
jgi:HSP20 family protein